MGSRNTFVTKFLYSVEAINIVQKELAELKHTQNVVVDVEFVGRHNDSIGYFHGVIKSTSTPFLVDGLLSTIDRQFAKIGYDLLFDIAIVCDDEPDVLCRDHPFGL